MHPGDHPSPDEAIPGMAGLRPRRPAVEDLVDDALDATVRTGSPAIVRVLLEELADRGDDAFWEAAALLLGLLATRPVYGLAEHQGVEHLRQVARTADPITSLVLLLQSVHRADGAAAAHDSWQQAPMELRGPALAQLLISVAYAIGTGDGRLDPQRTVRLIRAVIIDAP
ncbi:hypothetical protein P3T27_007984 [Kitasatospora sp. MAA19]|uniref:hypothetical protein n=1 Tax=Kitasatospora sp. MAA19 TaxID=3035090 RepID=UPI002472F521|nr:hypothetical protein [Kitasatospora sp. MAA19]MDH6711231.1 hypothetical protein [Kitasatospora sp. MAA19]